MTVAPATQNVANPLPYIIVFAILFLVALGILTWVLDVYSKQHSCALHPNIWCSDNWTCNNSCPTGSGYNACFNNVGSTGLASCLFGPDSSIATTCLNLPTGTGGTGAAACDCVSGIQQTVSNCFSGCAANLGDISNDVICCCQPGTPGCPYNSQTLPRQCLPSS